MIVQQTLRSIYGVNVTSTIGLTKFKKPPGFGDLTLNLANHDVHRGDQHIELSTRELTLLKVLMREPGRVFTRTELCERVWEREHEYDMKLVEVFIGRLRKKIGDPPLIHTVRHVGYSIRETESE